MSVFNRNSNLIANQIVFALHLVIRYGSTIIAVLRMGRRTEIIWTFTSVIQVVSLLV